MSENTEVKAAMKVNAGPAMVETDGLLSECEDLNYLRHLAASLWNIIDDIDTADDIAKDNDDFYRRRVHHLQQKRWGLGIVTDGYELFTVKGPKATDPTDI